MSEIIVIDNFKVDGYRVGDRLLEGVIFTAVVVFDTSEIEKSETFAPKTVDVLPYTRLDESYLHSLAGPGAVVYWRNEVSDFIKKNIGEVLDALDESDPAFSKLFELNEKYG